MLKYLSTVTLREQCTNAGRAHLRDLLQNCEKPLLWLSLSRDKELVVDHHPLIVVPDRANHLNSVRSSAFIHVGLISGLKVPYVPLLCSLKMSAHSWPLSANRLATMFLSHSMTAPLGCTNFHRSGLLLPIVVSKVTWRKTNIQEINKSLYPGPQGFKEQEEPHQTTAQQIKVVARENTARIRGKHLSSAGNNLLSCRNSDYIVQYRTQTDVMWMFSSSYLWEMCGKPSCISSVSAALTGRCSTCHVTPAGPRRPEGLWWERSTSPSQRSESGWICWAQTPGPPGLLPSGKGWTVTQKGRMHNMTFCRWNTERNGYTHRKPMGLMERLPEGNTTFSL